MLILKKFTVYLKFIFNQASCILFGNSILEPWWKPVRKVCVCFTAEVIEAYRGKTAFLRYHKELLHLVLSLYSSFQAQLRGGRVVRGIFTCSSLSWFFCSWSAIPATKIHIQIAASWESSIILFCHCGQVIDLLAYLLFPHGMKLYW